MIIHDSPCHKCADRSAKCHISCSAFETWKRGENIINAELNFEKSVMTGICEGSEKRSLKFAVGRSRAEARGHYAL